MVGLEHPGGFMSSEYMEHIHFEVTQLNDTYAAADMWMNIVLRHFPFSKGYGITFQGDFNGNKIEDKAFVANIFKLDRITEQICFSIIVSKGHGRVFRSDFDSPPDPEDWKKFEGYAAMYLAGMRNQLRFPAQYAATGGETKCPMYALVAMGDAARFYALEPEDDYPFECSGINDGDFWDVKGHQVAIDNMLEELSRAAWNNESLVRPGQ